jgi:hypothetical protein
MADTKISDLIDGVTANASDELPVARAGVNAKITPAYIKTYIIGSGDVLLPSAIGTTVQAHDAELSAIAGLTSAADSLPYFTGSGTAALATFTAYGRQLVDDADAGTARTTLGLTANGSSLVTAANYAAMRGLLDLEVGTDFLSPAAIAAAYQPLDADLTTIAGLSSADSNFIVGSASGWVVESGATVRTSLGLGTMATETAANYLTTAAAAAGFQPLDADLTTWAGVTSSANGRSLVSAANYAAMRALLDLEIGTDVQAQDAELTAIAGLASAADRLPYFTGSGTAALATFTGFARTVLDDADAATARTTLGIPLQHFGVYTIVDDNVATIAIGTSGEANPLWMTNSAHNGRQAMVAARAAASLNGVTVIASSGTAPATTTGVLTGTTGADGTITVSCDTSGNFYIENRLGFTVAFRVFRFMSL